MLTVWGKHGEGFLHFHLHLWGAKVENSEQHFSQAWWQTQTRGVGMLWPVIAQRWAEKPDLVIA